MTDLTSDQHGQDPAAIEHILAQAAHGHEEAWRSIVNIYTGRVYGLLVKQCHDQELAEEMTQATFVQVVQRLDRYQEQGRFESWLFQIAMNRLRDEMRRRKRQAVVSEMATDTADEPVSYHPDQTQSPLDKLAQDEEIHALKTAVAQLDAKDQEILYLRHTAGLSFPQIAQTLDQPLGTVLARGHRALAKLRTMMTNKPHAKTSLRE